MRAKTVNEVIAEPFTNNTRNQPIAGTYPLSRIQYEDVDKPDQNDISGEEIECDICGMPAHPGQFENGVCKKCAERGYWIDRFGAKHNQNSRERKQEKYT